MGAGRPHNSTTPIWRNKAAIKVRIYRWMKGEGATRLGCAKQMKMSRTTVVKWWDAMAWTAEKRRNMDAVGTWYIQHKQSPNLRQCAEDLGLPFESVQLDVATLCEMTPKYVI